MDLKPGETVTMVGDAQPMHLDSVDGNEAVCLWHGKDGKRVKDTFPLSSLRRLPPPSAPTIVQPRPRW